jgi:hypothetical protein
MPGPQHYRPSWTLPRRFLRAARALAGRPLLSGGGTTRRRFRPEVEVLEAWIVPNSLVGLISDMRGG